jgi:hypothetical protein
LICDKDNLVLPYESVIDIDDKGDEWFEGPHIYVGEFDAVRGPFRDYRRVRLCTIGQWCVSALPPRVASNSPCGSGTAASPKLLGRVRPGQELLQYVDEAGNCQDVTSTDVNDYLKEITGKDITAKDFRTWAGTVLAAMALNELESFDSAAQAKRNLRAAVEKVAGKLGNTPTICRKCYVHPEVLNS